MLENGTQLKFEEGSTVEIPSQEFIKIYSILSSIAGAPGFTEKVTEARNTLALLEAHNTLNALLEQEVEKGKAKTLETA